MNIIEAARILSEHRHLGRDDWRVVGGNEVMSDFQPPDFPSRKLLDGFTAIAVAEKLERDAGHDMPATRKIAPVYRRFIETMDEARVSGDTAAIRNSAGSCTLADLRAAVAEWPDNPNLSTETDS